MSDTVDGTSRPMPLFEPLEPRLLLDATTTYGGLFFYGRQDVAVGGEPYGIVSADFDADGWADLALANYDKEEVNLLYGQAGGSFARREDVAVGRSPREIVSADFNGDGRTDLALGSFSGGDAVVSLLYAQPGGTFDDRQDVALGFWPEEIASADFNGDGRADLALVNYGDDEVSLLYGQAGGGFGSREEVPVGDSPRGMLVLDFNGDGRVDLAVTNHWDGDVSVLYGQVAGGLGGREDVAVGDGPVGIVSSDFDGDGRADLAVANEWDNNVSVLYGQAGGGFGGRQDVAVGNGPRGIVSADFDGDGRADLAVANDRHRDVSVLYGSPGGGFGGREDVPVGIHPWGIVSADFNRDGRVDLAVTNTADGDVSVLYGQAEGGFGDREDVAVAPGDIPYRGRGVVSADFNGDARADLAVTNYYADDVSVFYGRAGGGFGDREDVDVGDGPHFIVSADFNRDGWRDLAVTNWWDHDVTVLYGLREGGFGGREDVPVGDHPAGVVAADFDGDRRVDLAVANWSDDDVSLLYGHSGGGFGGREDVAVGWAPWSIVSADFDGDGRADVAVTNRGDNDVSVLYGAAAGGFSAREDVVVGDEPYGIVAADFNGDCRVDLAVTNRYENDVSVLYARAGGGFSGRQDVAVGDQPYGIVAADFNGDGRADLAVTNHSDDDVSVLYGQAGGGFGALEHVPVGFGPARLVSADFDGDGRADLAVSNLRDHDVSLLYNSGRRPSTGYFFSQNDPQWKDDPVGASGATVGEIGCALTSSAMALASYGVDTDPGRLNAWLTGHGGYTADGRIYWAKAGEYSGGEVQYAASRSWTGSTAENDRWADLKALLDEGYRVVVKVDGIRETAALDSHWVLATGFLGGAVSDPGSYAINDPWLDEYQARTLEYYHDDAYDNTFFAMQVFGTGGGTVEGATDLGTLGVGGSATRAGSVGDGPAGDREADLYRFTLTGGAQATLDVRAERDGSPLDAYLRVLDASGREIAAVDDTSGQDPVLEVTLAAGTYYVGVSGYPNRSYDALAPGTGAVPGSTGFYRLDLDLSAPTAPPDEGTPVEALDLAGDFRPQTDGTHLATGTVTINDLLRVEGQVWYDADLNVYGSGEVWMDDVPGLGDVRIYTGTFGFAAGEAATWSLNEALSGLQVVGLDVSVNRFWLEGDGVNLQGHVRLPEMFGGIGVEVTGSNYVRLSRTGGMSFSGATFLFPSIPDLTFFGLPFGVSGLELHMAPDQVAAEGALSLPSVLGGTEVAANIVITNEDGGAPEVEVAGALEIDGPIPLGPGFSLEDVVLQVDMAEDRLYGSAKLYLPAGGRGVDVGVGFRDGYFDEVSLTVVNLNLCVVYGPPPASVPLVFLQDVGGSLRHLAPDEVDHTPVVLGGNMAFTAGPQIHVAGEDYYLLRLDLGASYDTGGRIDGWGDVLVGGGSDPLELAGAHVTVAEGYGLYADGWLEWGSPGGMSGYVSLEGEFHLGTSNDVYGSLEGHVFAPVGWEVAGAKAYIQYLPDDSDSNDYLMAGGKVGFWSHAVKFNLHTGEPDWYANYSMLEEVTVPSPPSGALAVTSDSADLGRAQALGGSAPYDFELPVGLEGAIFRIEWDQGDTDLHLTDPSGTVTYTPENVDDYPDVAYYKDTDGKQAVFEVLNPPGGAWQVTVTETEGIGGYRIEDRASTAAPAISILEPEFDAAGGPVTITWADEDSDSDAAVSLYYDTDREGGDGVLIADGISEDDETDTYTWDTTGVPTGEYYVYAVIDDGDNVPAISYATGRVSVVHPDAPAQVTGLNAPEGTEPSVRLTWDASAAPDLDHYRVRLTGDAAGEFYEQTVAANDAEVLVDGLTTGETYRVTVAAVDTDGHVGQASEPVAVVVGGEATVTPESGQWEVFAQPGTTYEAQVPGEAGDTFDLIDAPAGATLSPDGQFEWTVPTDADGWHEVLVHVTDAEGNTAVYRHHLLADGSAPAFAAGGVQTEVLDASTLAVTAPEGMDASGVLQYRFERDGAVAGDWQTSPVFTDTGLEPDTAYEYRVQLKDTSPDGRTSAWSDVATARTLAAVPEAPVLGEVTETTITLAGFAADGNPAGTEYAIYNATTGEYVEVDGTSGPIPVWQTAADWSGTMIGGLDADAAYELQAVARNAEGVKTAFGPAATARTARESEVPTVASSAINCSAGIIHLEFSEPVAISKKDLEVTDAGGTAVDLTGATLEHAPGTGAATLSFAGNLAEGHYTLTASGTSVQDLAGNLLDGDGNGTAGGDFELPLHILKGDANGDAKTNIFDLLKVRQNYLLPADDPDRDDNADVTGDGSVNIFDLLMVRQNYLRELEAPSGGAPAGMVLAAEASPEPVAQSSESSQSMALTDYAELSVLTRDSEGGTEPETVLASVSASAGLFDSGAAVSASALSTGSGETLLIHEPDADLAAPVYPVAEASEPPVSEGTDADSGLADVLAVPALEVALGA